MQLQPIVRSSVSDAVFVQLRDQILEGQLRAGDAMPSERTLSDALGVNRQAIREALKRLDQAGLVDINHGGATRVRNYRQSAGLDLLATLLVRSDGTVDIRVARSIMEMRASLGPDAARLCAARASTELTDHLDAVVESMVPVGDDLAALSLLDWRFWELVVDGADNVAYRLAFNSLRDGAAPLAHALPLVVGDELRDLDGHRQLAVAIGRGDGVGATEAARRLLQRGITALTALLAADPVATSPTGATS